MISSVLLCIYYLFFFSNFFFVFTLSFQLDYKQIAWGDEFILTRRWR